MPNTTCPNCNGHDICAYQVPTGHAHYYAYCRDCYDGAPDSAPIARLTGEGPTPNAAVLDYIAQLVDALECA